MLQVKRWLWSTILTLSNSSKTYLFNTLKLHFPYLFWIFGIPTTRGIYKQHQLCANWAVIFLQSFWYIHNANLIIQREVMLYIVPTYPKKWHLHDWFETQYWFSKQHDYLNEDEICSRIVWSRYITLKKFNWSWFE